MVTDDQVCLLPPPASVFARLEARVLFRLIGAGAVKAVRLLMVDALDFVAIVRPSHAPLSSALALVPLVMRARMNEAAWLSEPNTAGTFAP